MRLHDTHSDHRGQGRYLAGATCGARSPAARICRRSTANGPSAVSVLGQAAHDCPRPRLSMRGTRAGPARDTVSANGPLWFKSSSSVNSLWDQCRGSPWTLPVSFPLSFLGPFPVADLLDTPSSSVPASWRAQRDTPPQSHEANGHHQP